MWFQLLASSREMQQVWAQFITAPISCSLLSTVFPCSTMNSPSAAVIQECSLTPVWVLQGLQEDLEHPLSFFLGLGICRAFSHIFLTPLSQILCSTFYHLKYVTREEPAVLLMGSAVPCSRSPADVCAWHGTALASPCRSHLCFSPWPARGLLQSVWEAEPSTSGIYGE